MNGGATARASGHEPADTGVPWFRSLRVRLMLLVGLLVAAMLALAFIFASQDWRGRIVSEAEARTRFEAKQAADRLESTMRSVRISGEGIGGFYRAMKLGRGGLLAAMRATLEANPGTVGGLVAVEPGVLPGGEPLAYYVGIESRGVGDRDMLADGYPIAAQPWYRRTLAATAPWWSEPYFNETAGGRYMATLNLPLREPGGRTVGQVSLDIPVQAFSASLEGLRTVQGQRTALFAPAGTIAVHPDKGVAFANTLSELIQRGRRTDLKEMEEARRNGRRLAFTHVLPTGETRYSVLEPIGDSGWSLQLALSHDAILGEQERAMRLLALVALALVLAIALLIHRLSRVISVPLEQLTTSAGHFAAGEFEWPVPHGGRHDEVGVMARALERARDSIRLQLDEIERYATEKQRLQSELDIARDIQQSMLPAGCEFVHAGQRFGVQARLEPAKSVGGDFYSHFRHANNRLWFVVGDVSGKGVPAALFMARAVTVLEVAAAGAESPSGVLVEANGHLCEANDTCMFATVLCGVLDLANGELALASAGHDPPLLRRADGSIQVLAVTSGPALGFDAVDAFDIWHGRLQPGETLVAYTDGVTEAFDRDNQAFGEERMHAALHEARGAGGACDALVEAVHRFAEGVPQSDDITVFGIHYEAVASAYRVAMRMPGERGRLPEVMDGVSKALANAGIASAKAQDVLLVVEELVCNAMDHGVPPGAEAHLQLELELAILDDAVVLTLRDNGIAHDPLSQPPPDLDAPIGERSIGGLGIHLVRALSRSTCYQREGRWNTLRIEFDPSSDH